MDTGNNYNEGIEAGWIDTGYKKSRPTLAVGDDVSGWVRRRDSGQRNTALGRSDGGGGGSGWGVGGGARGGEMKIRVRGENGINGGVSGNATYGRKKWDKSWFSKSSTIIILRAILLIGWRDMMFRRRTDARTDTDVRITIGTNGCHSAMATLQRSSQIGE